MRCLVACVLLVSTVTCRPGGQLSEEEFTKLTMTVDKLNAIIKAYSQYKEFLPSYVYDPIDKMTDDQKTVFVQLINDYHAGKFEPKNYQDLSDIVKKSYPGLSDIMDPMYQSYQGQLAKLGPKAHEFADDQEKKLYEFANPDRIVWACNLFNNAQSAIASVNDLMKDQDEADKIDVAFPEAVKFLHSKEFDAYAIIVKQLKPLDCTKDRVQVFNTIKLFDQHSVLTTN